MKNLQSTQSSARFAAHQSFDRRDFRQDFTSLYMPPLPPLTSPRRATLANVQPTDEFPLLADPVCKLLGATGIDAMTRIMGFLLICMGMQFCINGVKEVAQDPVFHSAHAATNSAAEQRIEAIEARITLHASAATATQP